MKLEDYMSDLEKEIGTVTSVEECCPGVYYIEADEGARFHKEYYVLMDDDGYGYLAYLDLYGR